MNQLEKTILRQLFGDKQFAERVTPYLKEKYFFSNETAVIWRLYEMFHSKFRAVPSFAAIRIGLDSLTTLNEKEAKNTHETLEALEQEPFLGDTQTPWVVEQTEQFCQTRAIYGALQESIKLMDDPKASHAIPELMKEALAVSFDTHIGHDYFAEAMNRYEFYHKPESRLPFDLDTLNTMTGGGVPKKTLNIVMAGTNVGKSLALVHFAATYTRMGKNVLYITCEMAEEWIGQRTDANMMNIPMDDVVLLPQIEYEKNINGLKALSNGRLIIKEYPTATAHCGHFRQLLQELRLKQNFKVDVILVDYLGICASSRVKLNNTINSYTFSKFIAEELRGLAVEYDVPLWTAAQFNREGAKATDPGMTDVAESWGIPQTADFIFALVGSDELDKVGQISLIEMKNRYNKKRTFQHHLLGFDTSRMRLYELTAGQAPATFSLPPIIPVQAVQGVGSFGQRRKNPLKTLRAENQNAAKP